MRADAFGARPVYYTVEGDGSLRTARSAWPLIAAKKEPALDPAAAARALCHCLPAERSLFRDVARVPQGHVLVFSSEGTTLDREWAPPSPSPTPEAHTPEELLRLLRSAVRRLRPDTRAACSLSGGLDSATVMALLAQQGPVRAYTLVDDFADDGEVERARRLAGRAGVEHVEIPIREEELPEHMAPAVAACEDLLFNGRAVASCLFFRALRRLAEPVVLSGAGADEMLAGHPESLSSFDERRREEADLARTLLRSDVAVICPPVSAEGPDDLASRRLRLVTVMLPELTLPPECRASRAAGVEVRLPFLEEHVADFALRTPISLLLREGLGKHLLREAVRGLVPEELRLGPKSPRLAPGARSPRARARWLGLFAATLRRERVEALGFLDPARVERFLDDFAGAGPEEPGFAAREAVLMRLTSLAMLQDRIEKRAWPASS